MFIQKRDRNPQTANAGGEKRDTNTTKRACASVYVFWTVCGLKWVIWSQQTKGSQTGWPPRPSQPTYVRKRGWEEREKCRWRLHTYLKTTFKQCFTLTRNPREKVKDRGKALRTILMSETEPAWERKYCDVSWKEIPPWQRERDLFGFRWHCCASVKPGTHKKIFHTVTNWGKSQVYKSRHSQITFGGQNTGSFSDLSVQIPVIKIQHVSNVLILTGLTLEPVVRHKPPFFFPMQGHYRMRLKHMC